MKKLYNLYHNNIKIKNIVVKNKETKLSNFMPIYSKSIQNTWRHQFVKKYNNYYLDYFMLGLLWLEF